MMSNTQTKMTAAEYQAYLLQQRFGKKPKHRNKIVYIFEDGFVSNNKDDSRNHGKVTDRFDSQKEYARWCELRMLERAGQISDLKKQVPFEIHAPFTSSDGAKQRGTYYNADFTYATKDGLAIVEDVKGQDRITGKYLTTSVFNLKWKLLRDKYPQYRFQLY